MPIIKITHTRSKFKRINSLAVMGSLVSLAVSSIAWSDPTLVSDTYTASGKSQVYGKRTSIWIAAGKTKDGYLRFNLESSPNPGTVAKATLKVFVASVKAKTGGELRVHGLTEPGLEWRESQISGVSAPLIEPEIVQTPAVLPQTPKQWVEFDVTSYVSANADNENISFALTGTDTLNIRLDSKENKGTGHEAVLDIVWATAGVAGAVGPQGPAGTVASAVISTASAVDPVAGQLITAACDTGQMAIGGGVVAPTSILNQVLTAVIPIVNAPVIGGVLPITGEVADGWQGSWGLATGILGAALPTGTYSVYAICAPQATT